MNNLVEGWLNICKPAGLTSFAVVAKVRKILEIKKLGHLGTLDPLATGVLPLAAGRATKLISFLPPTDKIYLAEMALGAATTTQDVLGEVVQSYDFSKITYEHLKANLRRFKGKIAQIPPMYSAVHYQGKRLYEFARKGESVAVPPREVMIYNLRLLSYLPPKVKLIVHCSSGTYVRTLCHDLGRSLGCGGYLTSLVRLRSGSFALKQSLTLEVLAGLVQEHKAFLLPLLQPFADYPQVVLKASALEKLSHGLFLEPGDLTGFIPETENGVAGKFLLLLKAPGELAGVAEFKDGGWQPVRVLL
jgi:tRNA pseudouridine55 synthase